MLWAWRRCPLCAPLWLCEPLFCLWWYSCTLTPFRRLYGLFTVFCEVRRLYIYIYIYAAVELVRLCGGVLWRWCSPYKGTGLKSLYGANTGVLRGAAFPGCAYGILCRCGCSPLPCAALRGSVELVRRSVSGGRNKAPAQAVPGQRKSPDFSGRVVLFIHFQQFGKYYERENKNAK